MGTLNTVFSDWALTHNWQEGLKEWDWGGGMGREDRYKETQCFSSHEGPAMSQINE